MDRRAWFWLLALGAIWGASYLFIAIGLRDLSPGMVAFLRVALAAAVLIPIAAAQGALAGARPYAGWLVLVGAIQVAGPFILIAAGEEEISSSLAGILVAATPLWTAVLAIWVDHEERSQGLRLVGVLIGFAGVGLLLGVDLGGGGSELLGGLAVVAAALGYAIGGLLIKHRLAGMAPVGMSGLVTGASALLLLPVAFATRAGLVSQPRTGGGGPDPRPPRYRIRVRGLLLADLDRRPGSGVDRQLRGAGLRDRLRQPCSSPRRSRSRRSAASP